MYLNEKATVAENYSNKNLQRASLAKKDFSHADLSGSDLRGADFSDSNFFGANLSNVRTGIPRTDVFMLFILALAVSLISGYISAKAGLAIRAMFVDPDKNVRLAGIITIALSGFCILYVFWKGGTKTMKHLVIPFIITAIVYGIIVKVFGWGTGKGSIYFLLTLLMIIAMIYIGVIARAAAGNISQILFAIVALSGGMFGKSIAGGLAPVILAVVCMLISKRALSGAKNFEPARKIALFITTRFGTSFRHARLEGTDFSGSKLYNADFTGADISNVNWGDSKKINCKQDERIINDKKRKSSK